MSNHIKGKVIIAGAGPGDPELITYKAILALQTADVVLTDRLVSPVILERFVPAKAEVISVGKQANRSASVAQRDINKLLVRYAMAGKVVVRLKGGDVSVFSNVLDELQSLKDNDIPYEIIPGITAASGAAAYCGMPLTARKYASAVRFLSYHKQENFSEQYWKELAATNDTLVFYMSGDRLFELVEKLKQYKIDARKQLAIVEQATTPLQHVTVSELYSFEAGKKLMSPSLVIIGKVVALYKTFKWLPNINVWEEYFTPVESKLISYTETEKELLIA